MKPCYSSDSQGGGFVVLNLHKKAWNVFIGKFVWHNDGIYMAPRTPAINRWVVNSHRQPFARTIVYLLWPELAPVKNLNNIYPSRQICNLLTSKIKPECVSQRNERFLWSSFNPLWLITETFEEIVASNDKNRNAEFYSTVFITCMFTFLINWFHKFRCVLLRLVDMLSSSEC